MSAQHRAWVEAQADAIKYRRQMAELDAYANPSPAARDAAERMRETLAEKRLAREANQPNKERK